MPRRRGLEHPPIEYLADGEQWPDGDLRDDAPDVAQFIQRLVRRLNRECGPEAELSIYEVAKKAKVNPQTVTNLLKGKTWGDVPVIFKLEAVLERRLWSHDHIPRFDESRRRGEPLR